MATCEHTMTDLYGAVLRCVSKDTEPISIQQKIGEIQGVATNYYCKRHYFVHNLPPEHTVRDVKKMVMGPGRVHAKDMLPGDVLHTPHGNVLVNDIQITAERVKVLLSAGRTDPGEWESFENPYEEVSIYRHEATSTPPST